jgi:hypothetical protein
MSKEGTNTALKTKVFQPVRVIRTLSSLYSKEAITGIAYRNNLGNKKVPQFANVMADKGMDWRIKCFKPPPSESQHVVVSISLEHTLPLSSQLQ